jgi:hypothetical protein
MFDLQHDMTEAFEVHNGGEVYLCRTHTYSFAIFGWSCAFNMKRWKYQGIMVGVAPTPFIDLEQQPYEPEVDLSPYFSSTKH